MAEGFVHQIAGGEFVAASGGTASLYLHPLAISVMREAGVDIATQRCKTMAEAIKEHFAFAVSIYDKAKERNPVFPFAFRLFPWNISDPEESTGTEPLARFRAVRDEIERQVRQLLSGPARDLTQTPKAA
jgi:arsenate reductase